MEYFIRAYGVEVGNKSVKEIYKSKTPISIPEFKDECNKIKAKKFLLCVRGRGIKGFKKLDEYSMDSEREIFNAETISVNQKLTLDSLSNSEILNLMDNMVNNPPMDAEGQDKFMSDLRKFNAEIRERSLMSSNNVNASEDTIVSTGFSVGSNIAPFMVGLLTGGVVIYAIQKKEMEQLKNEITSLKDSIREAEDAIQNVRREAESIIPPKMSADDKFLAAYNLANNLKHS